jgi:ABC-type nitrate/sulfonate/bicarbonate transport system substrate-binding protein
MRALFGDEAGMDANPEALAAFRAAIAEATAWSAANEVQARKTRVRYLHLPDGLAMSVELPTLKATIEPAELQFCIDTCKELGVTKGSATLAAVLAR